MEFIRTKELRGGLNVKPLNRTVGTTETIS